MKHIAAASVASLMLAFSGSAYASDGTITFTGNVSAATCTVAVNNGTASGTVTLPTVSKNILAAAGSVAGATSFTINLSSCTTGKTINAFFEAGPTVDTATGNLLNSTATGSATNVEVQLLTAANSVIAVGTSGQAVTTNVVTSSSVTSGALNYVARYYATGASAAGTVSSSVTYSITYN